MSYIIKSINDLSWSGLFVLLVAYISLLQYSCGRKFTHTCKERVYHGCLEVPIMMNFASVRNLLMTRDMFGGAS